MAKQKLSKTEKELLTLLNTAWKLVKSKPNYKEFNMKIPCGKELLELERHYPKLGLASNVPGGIGISTLSIIATVTDVFCGKRLAAIIAEANDDEPEGSIIGWTFV